MDDMQFFAKTGALAHNASAVGRLNKLLCETVKVCFVYIYIYNQKQQFIIVIKGVAEKGEFVLTIGGDHSIGLGTLAGVSY